MSFLCESSMEVDGTPILIVYLKFYIFFFNHPLEPSISPLFIKKIKLFNIFSNSKDKSAYKW